MRRQIALFAFFLSALVFCGCASFNPPPLNTAAMTPNDSRLSFKSTGKTIALGKFSGPTVKGQNIYLVTTLDLRNVLTQGLERSQLFSNVEIEPTPKVNYVLNVSIMGQPEKGVFTCTTSLIVKYQIIRKRTGEVVFSKIIYGKCSVSTGHELEGVNRLRVSVQGAVKDNVSQFLKDISRLNL